MRTKIWILIVAAALLAALAYRLIPTRTVIKANPSGADALRVDDAIFDRLVGAAQEGDCDAAFTLARHHAFYTARYDEAIRWYRIAAKCPHIGAKGELVGMLMNLAEHDPEVDRLLSEIEQLDPKTAERTGMQWRWCGPTVSAPAINGHDGGKRVG